MNNFFLYTPTFLVTLAESRLCSYDQINGPENIQMERRKTNEKEDKSPRVDPEHPTNGAIEIAKEMLTKAKLSENDQASKIQNLRDAIRSMTNGRQKELNDTSHELLRQLEALDKDISIIPGDPRYELLIRGLGRQIGIEDISGSSHGIEYKRPGVGNLYEVSVVPRGIRVPAGTLIFDENGKIRRVDKYLDKQESSLSSHELFNTITTNREIYSIRPGPQLDTLMRGLGERIGIHDASSRTHGLEYSHPDDRYHVKVYSLVTHEDVGSIIFNKDGAITDIVLSASNSKELKARGKEYDDLARVDRALQSGKGLLNRIGANDHETYFTKQYGAWINQYLYISFDHDDGKWLVSLGSTNKFQNPADFKADMVGGSVKYDKLCADLDAINNGKNPSR